MMRHLLLLLALLALGPPLRSGADATAGSASPPATYQFVPGDVIDITVPSHMGYDRTLTIQPDGRIQYPSLGELVAAGLTPAQLAARIRQGLNAELVDPEVTVSLKEINKGLLRRVSVLGAVKNPGVFELKEQSTLAELLATAGGPTSVADLRRVTVTRSGTGERVIADISGAARTGEESAKVSLQPGDQILVPEGAPPTVTILGEVVKPGSYELEGEMRLLNAVSQAGGPTGKADLRRVTLTHTGQVGEEVIDLQDLITTGQQQNTTTNVLLRPGDSIVFPETEHKYYVLGAVTRADAYPRKANDRLLDAITTAGGSTSAADLSRVSLIRKDAQGNAVPRQIDLKQLMTKGGMAQNVFLRDGDVLYVPDKKAPPRHTPLELLNLLLYPFALFHF
jgi:polysaccharide export outer membrane protein